MLQFLQTLFSLCLYQQVVCGLGGQSRTDWWCGGVVVWWCGGVYTTDCAEQRMGWEWGPGNHWGDLAQLQLETIK